MSDEKVYTTWADLYDAAFDWDVRAQVVGIGGRALEGEHVFWQQLVKL